MNRLLIAGLDGATWAVLDPLLRAGRLPTLARLCEQGTRGDLASVWPPISAAAWATALTGMNPGRHGVYDFRNLDLSHYAGHEERLTTSADIAAPTLFDHAGDAGSIAYQIPLTYPPRPIHGVMVAGYPTPDRRIAYTYPPDLARRLEPPDTHTADRVSRATPAGQLAIFQRGLEQLADNVVSLSQGVDWRLLMFVTGAPDGAQHRFFKFVTPGYPGITHADRARHGDLLAMAMEAADSALSRILAAMPEGTDVLVISDHGGIARPWRAFHANAWLISKGWLAPRAGGRAPYATLQRFVEWSRHVVPLADWAKQRLPPPARRWLAGMRTGVDRIDWARTRAYRVKLSHPIEGIHLNLEGRQPRGVVPVGDYHQLRQEIMAALAARPEVVTVARREDVYDGPYRERAPDILFQLRPDLDGGAGLEHVVADVPRSWLRSISGYHDLTGILVAAGPQFRRGRLEGARLMDIAPTALHAIGKPVPVDMDGQVLHELWRSARPVLSGPATDAGARSPVTLSADEEIGIQAALRALGYLD